jgi:hypothetical protein
MWGNCSATLIILGVCCHVVGNALINPMKNAANPRADYLAPMANSISIT